MQVTDRMVEEVARYGTIRKPNEACGLIVAERVVELRNASEEDRTWNYRLGTAGSIVNQLRQVRVDLSEYLRGGCIVWHTHPNGLVGPSAGDMEHRIEGVEYLVVALTNDGPMAARF